MSFRSLLVLVICLLTSPLTRAQTLIGLYEFNGNLDNSVSGENALGSLTMINPDEAATTGFSSGAWTWSNAAINPGTGLKLEFGALPSSYSIGIVFQYTQVDDYRKLMDFTDGASDDGIYVSNEHFTAYLDYGGDGGFIAANTPVTFVLTYDVEGNYHIYTDNSPTPVFSSINLDGHLIGDSVRLFIDDGEGGEFSEGGSVFEIRVWDGALSPEQIPAAFGAAIPEPSTYALLLAGLALAAATFRRKFML